jgi:hypothetical protein
MCRTTFSYYGSTGRRVVKKLIDMAEPTVEISDRIATTKEERRGSIPYREWSRNEGSEHKGDRSPSLDEDPIMY